LRSINPRDLSFPPGFRLAECQAKVMARLVEEGFWERTLTFHSCRASCISIAVIWGRRPRCREATRVAPGYVRAYWRLEMVAPGETGIYRLNP